MEELLHGISVFTLYPIPAAGIKATKRINMCEIKKTKDDTYGQSVYQREQKPLSADP